MNTSEVLNRAADLIEERGWATGGGWITEESVEGQTLCLEGGIMAALGMVAPRSPRNPDFIGLWTCPAYKAVSDYLSLDVTPRFKNDPEPMEPLWRWNDSTSRISSEVIEVLRATAVIEAAKETVNVRESVSA